METESGGAMHFDGTTLVQGVDFVSSIHGAGIPGRRLFSQFHTNIDLVFQS